MNRFASQFVLLVFFISSHGIANAQRRWIVDSRGTGDFLDLPEAVDAASSGDVIRIVFGHSTATTVRKGVRIFGHGAGAANSILGHLIIEDIPAHESVVLGGLGSVSSPGPQLALTVRNCAGKVHLADFVMEASGSVLYTPSFVRIENCTSVAVSSCHFLNTEVRNTAISFSDCSMFTNLYGGNSLHGLRLDNCETVYTQCFTKGAPLVTTPVIIAGIRMRGGKLAIAGAGLSLNAILSGSSFTPQGPVVGPSIDSDGGVVELDPDVPLLTGSNRPGYITGNSQFIHREISYMRSTDRQGSVSSVLHANPGQGTELNSFTYAPPGATVWTFISLSTHPTNTPMGQLWVNPDQLWSYGTGSISPTGEPIQFSRPTGLYVCPSGTTFALQSIVMHSNGEFELTTPITPVLMDWRRGQAR